MRHRYLLGRYHRERYTQTFKLLPEEYDPAQIYMQSTSVNRTMQSGYSELMGLYPPGPAPKLSDAMASALSSFSAPPFKVRDASHISEQLGSDALPNGYVQVPIGVYNNDDINDDVSYDGCPWIGNTGNIRRDDDTVFAPYDWMV